MEPYPTFAMEASSLPFLLSPALAASFSITLFCCFVVSPPIRRYLSKVLRELPKPSERYFDSLLGSTVHATVVVFLVLYSLMSGIAGEHRVFSKSPLYFMTVQVSLGYFLADLLIILQDPNMRLDKASVTHHLFGITGLGLSLFFQGQLIFYIIFRLISELSTPFVNMRWILHEFHITHGSLFKTASYGMMITFFATRIVVMPWLWYDFYKCYTHPGFAIVSPFFQVWAALNFFTFDVLNVYWFYRMIRGAIKLYRRQKIDK